MASLGSLDDGSKFSILGYNFFFFWFGITYKVYVVNFISDFPILEFSRAKFSFQGQIGQKIPFCFQYFLLCIYYLKIIPKEQKLF